ncbi:hypothetical protein [Okeania sp. SIO3B5]|nr:hypothetical protein [Okeania sp. SIO3B5]
MNLTYCSFELVVITEGRRKREEGRRQEAEGRRKKEERKIWRV